jgi:gas vesicle protein
MTSQTNHITGQGDNMSETSDEIRENIEQRRRSMGSKIDQIQERLDPKYLRDQTQEVVRNVVADGTDAMMDYVRENTRELGSSLSSALKRHPLPAALIGLGLVWLMVDSVSGGSSDESYNRSSRGGYEPYRSDRRFYNYERAANNPEYRSQYGGGQYGGRSYSDQYAQNYGQPQYSGSSQSYAQGSQQGGDGASLKEKAMDAVSGAADAVSGAAENVRDTVKEWGQGMGEKASEIGSGIREQVGELRHDARWQAEQFRDQAGYRVRQASSDNPLMTGAIAFAIGAAAGLLLPPTRKENEWMGDARERFMSSAREAADKAVHRAEEIVQEVKPGVEEAIKDVSDSVKRTGQEAADRLKEAAQSTKAKVEQEVKSEVGKVEEKMASPSSGASGTSSNVSSGMSADKSAAKPANANPNRTSSAS